MKTDIMPTAISALVTFFIAVTVFGCSSKQNAVSTASLQPSDTSVQARVVYYEPYFNRERFAWAGTHPQRWDLTVFTRAEAPDTMEALRVIGLPGESIEIDGSGIRVDGSTVPLPDELSGTVFAPGQYDVPAGQYLLMSDTDGKRVEILPRRLIISRVVAFE